MSKNTLYIMSGLPYSGKTMLVKELIKRFDFEVVSADKILEENGWWKERHPTQNEWEKAYKMAGKEVEEYLSQDKSVIFDEANLLHDQRENLKKIAENLGVMTKLIYVKINRKEILKRWDGNLKTKKRNQLTKEILERTFAIFEEPKEEEKPIVYNSEMNLESWIKRYF